MNKRDSESMPTETAPNRLIGTSHPLATRIGVIGANFKTAPIAAREVLARRVTIEKLLHLRDRDQEEIEIVLLSTCNRVEIYFASEHFENAAESLGSLFIQDSELDFKTYEYADGKAIEHLFKVSAGLDSLVIGEAQILSQVRESYRVANERGLCGPTLSKLFSKACSTGREIRERYPKFTNGSRNSVSLSVVDLITEHFGNRKLKPNLLLVGSGKMIKLAASSFDARKLGRVVVAARRPYLKELAADKVVHMSDLARTIVEEDIDVIITATSSDDYVLKPSDLDHFFRNNRSKELLIFDISVPRNVDPSVSRLFHNVTLINLDDLGKRIAATEVEEEGFGKNSELGAIRAIISMRAHEFLSWMKEGLVIAPIMDALRKRAEAIRSEEVGNALFRLEDLTSSEREVIIKMSERIMRRFLHEPTSNIKNSVRIDGGVKSKEFTNLLKELFSLDFAESSSDEILIQKQISKSTAT